MNGVDVQLFQIQTQAMRAPLDPQTIAITPIMVLAADYPGLVSILDGFGIDSCCGGHLTVEESCRERGLSAPAVAKALFTALQLPGNK